MRVQSDKDQWWERAACRGTGQWVFANEPGPSTVDDRLSICAECPVRKDCAQDLVNTDGPAPYPYQIRAGLVLWTDDVDQLPDVIYSQHVPETRAAHRPRHALSILNVKPQGGSFNPHTRGEWNT